LHGGDQPGPSATAWPRGMLNKHTNRGVVTCTRNLAWLPSGRCLRIRHQRTDPCFLTYTWSVLLSTLFLKLLAARTTADSTPLLARFKRGNRKVIWHGKTQVPCPRVWPHSSSLQVAFPQSCWVTNREHPTESAADGHRSIVPADRSFCQFA